ncbi:hypothetical protein BsWGS_19741 [Bradybaena similaris]
MGDKFKMKARQSKSQDISSATWAEPRSSKVYDRVRTLNSYDLKTPMYQIKSQYLIEDYVEKAVQFVGEISGVSPDLDITNRTDVLRIIDKGKKEGVVPVHVSHENYAILSLSVFNIKISKYSANEELLLLRIPVHEIAAICYIKDDQQHILAIKYGNQEACKLALLFCENKPAAEEICALMNQCFTLVYTEATVNSIERLISPTEHSSPTSIGTASTLVHRQEIKDIISFQSASVYRVPSGTDSVRNSTSDIGTGKELLEDYMAKLTTKLTPEELRLFLRHLNDWKKDNHFNEFCDEVLHLLGPERKQLLSELLPFIPSDNYQYFEEFLRINDIQLLENTSTFSSSRTDLVNYSTRGSLSEVSTASSMSTNAAGSDVLDHFLDLAKAEYNSVDVDIPEDY